MIDTSTHENTKTLVTSFGAIHSLAVTQKYIICGTVNQNINLYDFQTFNFVRKLIGHVGSVVALQASVSGQVVDCHLTITHSRGPVPL